MFKIYQSCMSSKLLNICLMLSTTVLLTGCFATYKQLNMMVGESFNRATLLNILWLPGFAIDAVTGAYKQYPSHYVVTMEESGS